MDVKDTMFVFLGRVKVLFKEPRNTKESIKDWCERYVKQVIHHIFKIHHNLGNFTCKSPPFFPLFQFLCPSKKGFLRSTTEVDPGMSLYDLEHILGKSPFPFVRWE